MVDGGRVLVLGGARSGKSGFAERLAGERGAVRYIATAAPDPANAEFAERVARHRVRRPVDWTVVESADPADALALPCTADATLIDDLGSWLAACPDTGGMLASAVDTLVGAVRDYSGTLVIVSQEVSAVGVPESRAGRLLHDELGRVNRRLAEVCESVFRVVAGVPMRVV